MNASGRPRRITTDAIVDAGVKLTLPNVTVRGVAAALGVSEMSIYRRVGDVEGLRNIIAESIVERADLTLAEQHDPEDALVNIALRLREFVIAHPGIAEHLANLGPGTPLAIDRIDKAQTDFAVRYGLTPAVASILVSTVAEHAVALASMNPLSHREQRNPETLREPTSTVRAGAIAAAALSPEGRFEWSIRATARGVMVMLGMPIRTDVPLDLGLPHG